MSHNHRTVPRTSGNHCFRAISLQVEGLLADWTDYCFPKLLLRVQFVVKLCVLRIAHYFKVLGTVVQLVSIDVMSHFSPFEFPAKMFFKHFVMLKSVTTNASVSSIGEMASFPAVTFWSLLKSLSYGMAFFRAVNAVLLIGRDSKYYAATRTGFYESFFPVGVRWANMNLFPAGFRAYARAAELPLRRWIHFVFFPTDDARLIIHDRTIMDLSLGVQ